MGTELTKETMVANAESETFKVNYVNLRTIAEKMRSQQEPEIDQLIPQVDSALASYKVCKDRLDTVKRMLEERFVEEIDPVRQELLEICVAETHNTPFNDLGNH